MPDIMMLLGEEKPHRINRGMARAVIGCGGASGLDIVFDALPRSDEPPVPAGTVSKDSCISRSRVYSALASLVASGRAERIQGGPNLYRRSSR